MKIEKTLAPTLCSRPILQIRIVDIEALKPMYYKIHPPRHGVKGEAMKQYRKSSTVVTAQVSDMFLQATSVSVFTNYFCKPLWTNADE